MSQLRICVLYFPRLYSDLFQKILQRHGRVQVIGNTGFERYSGRNGRCGEMPEVDLIILSLDQHGRPAVDLLPGQIPDVELIAFSPYGDRGYQRKPGDPGGKDLRPFGVPELMQLVQDRREPDDNPQAAQDFAFGD